MSSRDLVQSIGCWLDFEAWALHSEMNAGLQSNVEDWGLSGEFWHTASDQKWTNHSQICNMHLQNRCEHYFSIYLIDLLTNTILGEYLRYSSVIEVVVCLSMMGIVVLESVECCCRCYLLRKNSKKNNTVALCLPNFPQQSMLAVDSTPTSPTMCTVFHVSAFKLKCMVYML